MQERELIDRSKKGEEAAFTALMHAYEQKIFQLCLHIVKDEGIAHDLTQETFVKAYRRLGTFRMEASFYTWIYKIAKNLCLNYLRRKEPIAHEFKEEFFFPALPQSQEVDPALNAAVQSLPPKQRAAFEMFVFQQLSIKEIATRLQIPSGTVRSRLFYARQKIKRTLKS